MSRSLRLALVVALAAFPRASLAAQAAGEPPLASFGDRGLTTFGDRFVEGFSQRGLESFARTPLAPMGGLDNDGWSAAPSKVVPERGRDDDRRARRRRERLRDPSCSFGARRFPRFVVESGRAAGAARMSVATVHGVASAAAGRDLAPLALPPVALPALRLDHRAAQAELAAELLAQSAAARARGEVGVARQLAAATQR